MPLKPILHALMVSIHAPTRGATGSQIFASIPQTSFNSRAHEGRDCHKDASTLFKRRFQFTRPRGARQPKSIYRLFCRLRFQFTRPRGARLFPSPKIPAAKKFQFTRPRGARLLECLSVVVARNVSIHAPTRGATIDIDNKMCGDYVSIHAPTRGATIRRNYLIISNIKFQFTRPRGARQLFLRKLAEYVCFNSRAHEGRDPANKSTKQSAAGFNSRAHEGRDIKAGARIISDDGFNSRAHEGRD